jgi:hypothetical protein
MNNEDDEAKFLDFLDWEIKSIITKQKNMKNLYENKQPLITFLLYHNDDYIYNDAEAHIIYDLKEQLQHLGYCEANVAELNRRATRNKDKLQLLKATYNLVINEANAEEIDDTEITHLLLNDEWAEIIQHYKYYREIQLCEIDDTLHTTMLNIFTELDEERVYNVAEKIALNKIKRSKPYNFGLGLKINMKNCGIELAVA